MPAVTLDEFKKHLNLSTGTTHDEELQLHLDAAEGAVEGRCGPLDIREVTETARGVNGMVAVTKRPLVEVISLTEARTVATWTDLETLPSGVISHPTSYLPSVGYTVVYEAGRDPVPDDLRLAVLLIAEQTWKGQRGGRPAVTGNTASGQMSGQDAAKFIFSGSDLPGAALARMAPHMDAGIA
jgi:hypothetical protein